MAATTISATADGFEARKETDTWPGEWYQEGNSSIGVTVSKPDQNLIGFFASYDYRYKSAVKFGPINIGPTDSVSQFDFTFNISEARKRVQLKVKAVKDSTIVLGPSALPSNQVLTSATVNVSTSEFTDYNEFDYWTITQPNETINLAPLVQEVIQDPTWQSGNYIWFVIDFDDFGDVPGPNGWLYFYSVEHPTETPAQVTYEAGVGVVVTSVGGDNKIQNGQQAISVIGVNFDALTSIKITSGGVDYPQTKEYVSNTALNFNVVGNLPVGPATFVAVYGGNQATLAIEIEQVIVIPEGIVTSIDGFEYVDEFSSFPGPWVTKTQDAIYSVAFTNQILVGRYNGQISKASFKVGPIDLDQGTSLSTFKLLLNIANGFADGTVKIQAVADPTDADIGTSNVISSQTLTTASVVDNWRNWPNQNPGGSWVPDTNPYPISIRAVAQEVINNAGWTSGSSIQFIVDFDSVGANQGWLQIWARESGNPTATVTYTLAADGAITSVSSDNVIYTDETNIVILGENFGSITNFNISKGGISENQSPKSVSPTRIVFDLALGSIVADTGYTLSFDSGGTTLSTTIEVIAAVATPSIVSVNGNNTIRDSDKNVVISGTAVAAATSISIFKDTKIEAQTILTAAATSLTFDFRRGNLGYGDGYTLRVVIAATNYDFTVRIEPAAGLSFVALTSADVLNNSIAFDADPPFVAGDILVYQNISNQGFPVTVNGNWRPTIVSNTSPEDYFLVRVWDSVTCLHDTDFQKIVFRNTDYFVVNPLPVLTFSPIEAGDVEVDVSDQNELWIPICPESDGEDFT